MSDAPGESEFSNATSGIDFRTIMLVRAIDVTGSMSGAARVLGLSQPAVTQHLQRAEARAGLTLVDRSGHGARLTEAGAVLREVSDELTQSLSYVSARLDLIRGRGAGRLRLAGFGSFTAGVLPALLRTLTESHPGSRWSRSTPEQASEVVQASIDLVKRVVPDIM